jgi:tRNA threonylcarbamoyladenosine biosynthesis protein TsaE
MKSLVFLAENMADTDRLGTVLADLLPGGTTVALCGTLGSGKTRLVQAIAAACDVPRERVVSPTFVLCQEYQGRRTIFHLDAYRLQGSGEFMQLGPEEYFDSPGLTLIEWSDRVSDCLPAERIEVFIEVTGEASRSFRLVAVGDRFELVLAAIEARLRE